MKSKGELWKTYGRMKLKTSTCDDTPSDQSVASSEISVLIQAGQNLAGGGMKKKKVQFPGTTPSGKVLQLCRVEPIHAGKVQWKSDSTVQAPWSHDALWCVRMFGDYFFAKTLEWVMFICLSENTKQAFMTQMRNFCSFSSPHRSGSG